MPDHSIHICDLGFLGLDSDLALYLLVILSLFWASAARNVRFTWHWHVFVRAGIIITFALLGLTIGPRSPYACLAWLSFIVLYIAPIISFKQFTQAILESNATKLVNVASWMRIFIWGKQGQFLYDCSQALAFYIKNDKKAADTLLDKWSLQNPPSNVQNQIAEFRWQGSIWCHDWSLIIKEYEMRLQKGIAIPFNLNIYACRAYNECGQIKDAADCLNRIGYPKSTDQVHSLAAILFTLYCSLGDSDQAEQLLKLMSDNNYRLPIYIKHYWLGRLAMVKKDNAMANDLFDQAIKDAQKFPAWQKRIADQKQQVNEALPNIEYGDALLDPTWQKLKSAMSTQELIRPRKRYMTVTLIVSTILFVFFLANSYSLLPNQLTYLIEMFCYKQGILIPANVLAGEYWRLFTFLFLHVHLIHALLNILALIWLGRMAEKIYGLRSFLFIYFFSGIMSGIVSVAVMPTLPAIGASGAIMGIFGAVGVGIFRLKNYLPASLRRRQLTLMIGLLIFQLIVDQIIPHIDVGAHLGGLISGMLLGLSLPIPLKDIRSSTVST